MRKQKTKSELNIQGIISVSRKGTGYIKVIDREEDIEVDSRHLNTALNGDMVEAILHPFQIDAKRQTGEVLKIISRAKGGFAGVLERENGIFFLKPDDPKMYTDILIPQKRLGGVKVGQKVFGEIVSWNDPRKAPEGKIVRILGRPGENEAEMQAIVLERGFAPEIKTEAQKEAQSLKRAGITPRDYNLRRDFRQIPTLTIDPEDAKDFDDAISIREIGAGEWEVGVHIADVSHYVKWESALDREARERGTSVYLVDRTIPMLPEILSNDLCSLLPGVDRLCLSAVFILDKEAKVKKEWFGKTVINSQKRFTYREAEKAIKESVYPWHKELAALNRLAKKLMAERFREGAISLDQAEVKFVLAPDGAPIKVVKKERGDSNKLIEEFMLLANKKVAETISAKIKASPERGAFVYRVHDAPNPEKMENLAFFLRSLGYKIALKNGVIENSEINKILESLEGKSEKDTIHRVIVQSMAKAVYSTHNIGHYGLAFKHYTHFTSPIRRYPDIIAHRILTDYCQGKKIASDKLREYEIAARISSEQERRAADAERASVKLKYAEYMAKRLGQKFKGVISGITEWGIYVEEAETKCEGLVRIRDMRDDYYIFNEKRLELSGEKKHRKYRLGDQVTIKVKAVDLAQKTIDYILI